MDNTSNSFISRPKMSLRDVCKIKFRRIEEAQTGLLNP